MGARVENNVIKLTRGDSYTFVASAGEGDDVYQFESGDVLKFCMKHKSMNLQETEYEDSAPILEKVLSYADPQNIQISFVPSDTENLPFGVYIYDICVFNGNVKRNTLLETTEFHVCREVHSNE